jgi:hypothetical protein
MSPVMSPVLLPIAPPTATPRKPAPSQPPTSEAESAGRRPLTESDAIDIWIARWLRLRRKDILARYGCDPRRLYEIWEETRFVGSREKARTIFEERYPTLIDRIDWGPHRRIPRAAHPDQMALFEA